MLKYKEWKQLNESFLGPVTLGLGKVQNLGIQGANFKLEDLEAIEEAAKKGKKKMLGDDPDGGGLEKIVGLKKKIKGDKDELKGDEEELEGDDDDLDGDLDDDGDDDLGDDDDDLDGDKDDLGGGAKKKVKLDLGGDPGAEGGKISPMMKKCKKGGKGKKCESTERTEEQAWWDSLSHQLSADPNKRYSDGTEFLQKEDAVIPPSNANASLVSDEPGPGDIGFSPQQRFGVGSEDGQVEAKNPVGDWGGFSTINHVEQGIRDQYDW